MHGVAVALQALEEAEAESADGQTHQRHGHTHPRQDAQEELVQPGPALPNMQNAQSHTLWNTQHTSHALDKYTHTGPHNLSHSHASILLSCPESRLVFYVTS